MTSEELNEAGGIKSRDPLTEKIIACSYKVHRELGPGFNERIYHNALKLAFEEQGLEYETEKSFRVHYQGRYVGVLKVDLIVSKKVIVEVKALTGYLPIVFQSQILSYLKISGIKVGLLINFGNKSCEIRRLNAKEAKSD